MTIENVTSAVQEVTPVNVVEAKAGDVIPIYFYVKARAHQTRVLKLCIYRKSYDEEGRVTKVVEAQWDVAFANEKYGRGDQPHLQHMPSNNNTSNSNSKKRSSPSSSTIAVPVARWNVAYFSTSVSGKLRICDEHKAKESKWYKKRWVAAEAGREGGYHDIEICVLSGEHTSK